MNGTDRLLRLYPARYRSRHGDEIAAVFEEATAGLTGRALLRERAALAGHALRIRAGISSAQPGGRALAAAAPFALGALASVGVPYLGAYLPVALSEPGSGGGIASVLDSLPMVLALVCALAGRRTTARIMLLLTVVEKLVLLPMVGPDFRYLPEISRGPMLAAALFALLALAAPPDLAVFDGRSAKTVLLTTTAFSILPIYLFHHIFLPHSGVHGLTHLESGWPVVFPAVAMLAALVGSRADLSRAAGSALAALPWVPMFSSYDASLWQTVILSASVCLPLVGAIVLAGLLRVARRGRVAQPLDPA